MTQQPIETMPAEILIDADSTSSIISKPFLIQILDFMIHQTREVLDTSNIPEGRTEDERAVLKPAQG
jgi:hypothetical protein